jgi:hypothetical protein
MNSHVRPAYRNLSSVELMQKAYDLGVAYEMNSFSCSQSTVAALYRLLDFPEVIVKAASSNAGGTALQLMGTCGGLVGGIMVLDTFFGRPFEHMSDTEIIQDPNVNDLVAAHPKAKALYDKYSAEYGTIICANIQHRLFGRTYYLDDADEMQKFNAAGGHSDPKKCPSMVGNAARWVMEILLAHFS